jgi:hypothetical protein
MMSHLKYCLLVLWVMLPLCLLIDPATPQPKGKEYRQHQRRANRRHPRQAPLPKSNPKWRIKHR